ncbi:MAG TPA: PKD domain-containing protein, partial [Thermoplasmatales archaeon]|nr:PKD domain-containing protein [Thermoplasmatales archaeon]
MRARIAWFIILTLLTSMLTIDNAAPGTIYVDDDGPADYTSIQDAIDAAQPGDEVYVYEGVYQESLIINKQITLRGENKRAVIECAPQEHGITVTADSVHIEGFTITFPSEGYYGIELNDADNCLIKNCNISSGYGGIHCYRGEGLTVMGTVCYETSYGISAVGLKNAVIRENFFIGTTRGIDFGSDTRNNTFFYNTFLGNIQDAYDESSDNHWNYNNVGNYWEKYNGIDEDEDGIGDTKYPIDPVEKGNFDYYPLMEPYAGIDIFPPDILELTAHPQIQVPNGSINITCVIIDNVEVNHTYINITLQNGSFLNESLKRVGSTDSYYYNVTFAVKGIYYYYVWANDTNNNSIKSSMQLFVVAYKPQANFSYSPPDPTDLDTITFDASASTDPDGTIENYTWDLGGGTVKYGKIVTHKYTENSPPIYTVTLTVYDDDGAWDSMEKSLFIANVPPVANFSFYPDHAVVGQNVTFTDSSYDPDG